MRPGRPGTTMAKKIPNSEVQRRERQRERERERGGGERGERERENAQDHGIINSRDDFCDIHVGIHAAIHVQYVGVAGDTKNTNTMIIPDSCNESGVPQLT